MKLKIKVSIEDAAGKNHEVDIVKLERHNFNLDQSYG